MPSWPRRGQDIYPTKPSGHRVIRSRRSTHEADCQCMFPWHARGLESHSLRHNRHTRHSNRAFQDRHPIGDHRVRPFFVRDILPRHVSNPEEPVDSHCSVLLGGSHHISCGSDHAGCVASLIGVNLGRSWKQAALERVCVPVHLPCDWPFYRFAGWIMV